MLTIALRKAIIESLGTLSIAIIQWYLLGNKIFALSAVLIFVAFSLNNYIAYLYLEYGYDSEENEDVYKLLADSDKNTDMAIASIAILILATILKILFDS